MLFRSYSSTTPCDKGSSTARTQINILCDNSVEAEVTSATTTVNGCLAMIGMRSKYGCGFPAGQPLTCKDTDKPKPSTCTLVNDAFTCQSPSFSVSVKNARSAPAYTFSATSNYNPDNYDPTSYAGDNEPLPEVYTLKFVELLEVSAAKNIEARVRLDTLPWIFTQPEVIVHNDKSCSQETTFNLTSANATLWSRLTLVNHVPLSALAKAKFDVVIEDYVWQSPNTTHLVFTFSLNSTLGGLAKLDNATRVTLGYSYFSIVPTATAYVNGSASAAVSAKLVKLDTALELAYSRFNGSLVHDPQIGINLPSPVPPVVPCDEDVCEIPSLTVTRDLSGYPKLTLEGNSTWIVEFVRLQEILVNTQGYSPVRSSIVEFDDAEWTTKDPITVVLPDGSAHIRYTIYSGLSDHWDSISISVDIPMKKTNSHITAALTIANYKWRLASLSSSLQLEISVGGPGMISYSYTTVLVGYGYLQTTPIVSAVSTSGAKQSPTLMLSYHDEVVYAAISHFNGTVTVPFTIGINTNADLAYIPPGMINIAGKAEVEEGGASIVWLWVLGAIGILVLIVILVVGSVAVYRRYKRSSYEPISG